MVHYFATRKIVTINHGVTLSSKKIRMKKVNLILSLIGMGVSGIVVGVLIGYFTTKRVNRNQIPPRVH